VKISTKNRIDSIEQQQTNQSLAKVSYWTNPEFDFIQTNVGKKRIKKELEELQDANYETSLLTTGERAFIQISIGSRKIVCIPPREYPLNPPRLFWKDTRQEINQLGILTRWSSDWSILEAVREIRKKLSLRYYSRKWRQLKPSRRWLFLWS